MSSKLKNVKVLFRNYRLKFIKSAHPRSYNLKPKKRRKVLNYGTNS